MFIYLILTIALLLIVTIHYFITKSYRYWKKRGISCYCQYNPYKFIYLLFTKQLKFIDDLVDQYKAYPQLKCYGVYDLTTTQLLIRDPELIRIITVKDFDHYTDRTFPDLDNKVDPFWGNNLLFLRGKRWHEMRTTLSPAFTGSKMRGMFNLITKCCEQFVIHFKEKYKEEGKNDKPLAVELKNILSRFTADAIATTAFGIEVNSLKNPDNEFFKTGQSIKDDVSFLKIVFAILFPNIYTFLGLTLMSPRTYSFFRGIVKEILETRAKNKIVRPDMINLLMEAKEALAAEKKDLTDDEITAQCFLFFIAGFESVSSTICFSLYELALNPDIQTKLQKEIDETMNKTSGNIDYDILKDMKYLDMVVSETLRKWPVTYNIDRSCTKKHILKFDDQEIEIEPGTGVVLPLLPIHRDEKYFPSPEKFDPERFSDENKHLIKPFTYFPFGIGPRICIAARFALMETKLLILHLLANFNFEVIEKTQIPLVLLQHPALLGPRDGIWIGFKTRA